MNVTVGGRDASLGDRPWGAIEPQGRGLEGAGPRPGPPSGTEPVVRVMVEAPEQAECEEVLGRLVAVARRELG